MLYRSPTEFNQVSNKLHVIQIIKFFIDYIAYLSVPQISSTYGEIVRNLLTNRKLRFLQFSLCLHMCDINNIALSYEDKEVIFHTLNNPESIECDIQYIQDNEYLFQLLSYLT
jgi:hypothetical protein